MQIKMTFYVVYECENTPKININNFDFFTPYYLARDVTYRSKKISFENLYQAREYAIHLFDNMGMQNNRFFVINEEEWMVSDSYHPFDGFLWGIKTSCTISTKNQRDELAGFQILNPMFRNKITNKTSSVEKHNIRTCTELIKEYSIFKKTYLEANRHYDPNIQHAYDKRFGLTLYR